MYKLPTKVAFDSCLAGCLLMIPFGHDSETNRAMVPSVLLCGALRAQRKQVVPLASVMPKPAAIRPPVTVDANKTIDTQPGPFVSVFREL